MSNSTRYSPELSERAVRIAIENRADYKSEWATLVGVSKLFGMSPETLRSWVRKAQIDSGPLIGVPARGTTPDSARYGVDITDPGSMPRSRSTSRAALRPGRPETEPPGCEVEPVR